MIRILVCVFFLLPFTALAHVPYLPEYSSYETITTVTEPQVSKAYYAELRGYPHRYSFTLPEEQEVFLEVLVPDIATARNEVGAIVMQSKGDGLFSEVARLESKNATWESFYEPFGGDSYRKGPSFQEQLPAGEYLVEVSTAFNNSKYVFVMGELEDFSDVGILETMKRIYEVKRFYGKPLIAVLQSPFYYIPFSIVLLIILVLWYRKRNVTP